MPLPTSDAPTVKETTAPTDNITSLQQSALSNSPSDYAHALNKDGGAAQNTVDKDFGTPQFVEKSTATGAILAAAPESSQPTFDAEGKPKDFDKNAKQLAEDIKFNDRDHLNDAAFLLSTAGDRDHAKWMMNTAIGIDADKFEHYNLNLGDQSNGDGLVLSNPYTRTQDNINFAKGTWPVTDRPYAPLPGEAKPADPEHHGFAPSAEIPDQPTQERVNDGKVLRTTADQPDGRRVVQSDLKDNSVLMVIGNPIDFHDAKQPDGLDHKVQATSVEVRSNGGTLTWEQDAKGNVIQTAHGPYGYPTSENLGHVSLDKIAEDLSKRTQYTIDWQSTAEEPSKFDVITDTNTAGDWLHRQIDNISTLWTNGNDVPD